MRIGARISGPLLTLALLMAACSEASPENTTPGPDSSSTAEPTGEAAGQETEPDSAAASGRWTSCRQLSIDGDSRVEQDELVETSGLAASSRDQEVLWAHNDGGNRTAVYAMDLNGEDLGLFELAGVDGFDAEDIALVAGRIYLADIGDNDRQRETVQLHIFDELDPRSDSGPIENITTVDLAYPDEPTDAEALLVDPRSDEVVILSKDLEAGAAATRIYSFAMPAEPTAEPIEMNLAGEIDVAGLASQATDLSLTAVLFPGLLTAADISTDGSLIAVRTYATVWLYPRAEGQTMAEALQGEPCEGGTAAESQGEAVAILPGSPVRYVTASEGSNPTLNVVSIELD